jgi:hypothetical protein
MMRMIQYFNGRVKKLDIFDLKLIQGSAMILAVIIAKMVPQVMAVNIWWLVGLLVLFLVRPAYAFYFKA